MPRSRMNFGLLLALLGATFLVAFAQDRVEDNEDIRNTWTKQFLDMCLRAEDQFPPASKKLSCHRHRLQLEYVDFELYSERPVVMRIRNFVGKSTLSGIEGAVKTSSEVEEQGVQGLAYSPGHRGRRADGLWLLHNDTTITPLYDRMQHVLRLNPAIAEDFLILKYDVFGHYAPHYDHLDPMTPQYDQGWFAYFGNRLATALLIVKTATKGGGTVFPYLRTVVQPEPGDLILWFNADSNDVRETDSLHAACPIEEGEKIAVSLWIRGNFQDCLKCSISHPGYAPLELLRSGAKNDRPEENRLQRPTIPEEIAGVSEDYEDWEYEEYEEGEEGVEQEAPV